MTANAEATVVIAASAASACTAVSSAVAVATIAGSFLLPQPLWLRMLAKEDGDVPNGLLPRSQFVQLGTSAEDVAPAA